MIMFYFTLLGELLVNTPATMETLEGACLDQIEVDRAIVQFSFNNHLFTSLKAYDKEELQFGGLKIPTDNFLIFLRQLNQCFENRFDASAYQRKIAGQLKTDFLSSADSSWFDYSTKSVCHRSLMSVVDYFIRMRTHYWCGNVSKNLVSSIKNKQNRKYRKLANL